MTPSTLGPIVEAIVIGNVAFDILCYPVNDVPRHQSLTFERAAIAPGGCGSNAAIGLAAQGVPTALVACIGSDLPAQLAMSVWDQFGVNTDYVIQMDHEPTGVSVGLVDTQAQPRFVHTSGTNQFLKPENIPLEFILQPGLKAVHFAGYFLMAGMLDEKLRPILDLLHAADKLVSFDVQQTARLSQPELLWYLLPEIDIFSCNRMEAAQITGTDDEMLAAKFLHEKGAQTVIVKLGHKGCYLSSPQVKTWIQAPEVNVVDTTGAGDAFSAGLIAAFLRGDTIEAACRWANGVAANVVTHFGAIAAWEKYQPEHIKELLHG